MNHLKSFSSELILLSIAMVWGSTFVLIKNALPFISPIALIALRFTLAGAVLMLVFQRKLRLVNKQSLIHGFIIGVFLFGSLILQVIGLKYTKASNSAFITGLNVVMVPVIAGFYLGKKTIADTYVGIALSVAGLFYLNGGEFDNFNIGDVLTFFCAICVAMQIIYIDKFSRHHDGVLLGVLQIFWSGCFSWIYWGCFDFKWPVLNGHVVLAVAVTGLLATAYAYTMQTVVQKHTTPSRTALIFTMEPVFALVFALVIPDSFGMRETITIHSIAGCLLIFSGMIVAELRLISRSVSS